MSDTVYRISKEACEKTIQGVCPGCGGELSAIETVDNSGNPTFWVGCEHCNVFTHGVPVEHFRIARNMVEKGIIIPYTHITKYDDPESIDYWLCSQTKGLASTVTFVVSQLKDKTE